MGEEEKGQEREEREREGGREGGRERGERAREGGRKGESEGGGIAGVKVMVCHQLTVEGFAGVSELQLRSLNQIKINMIEM